MMAGAAAHEHGIITVSSANPPAACHPPLIGGDHCRRAVGQRLCPTSRTYESTQLEMGRR
jgi:hypothetical protein